MAKKHPVYTNYLIYDGNAGEKPTPGAFYAMTPENTLSGVAKKAYGDASLWKWINKNATNRMSGIGYRVLSSGKICGSKKAKPDDALIGKAFIGPCKADRAQWMIDAGYKMPVLWIPSYTEEDPKKDAKPAPKPAKKDDKPIEAKLIRRTDLIDTSKFKERKKDDKIIADKPVDKSDLYWKIGGIGIIVLIAGITAITLLKKKKK